MADKKDIRGEAVEKYRLTPEQMAFQKKFKKLKQIQQLLEARSLGLAAQLKNEQALWQDLEGEFQTLQPPQKSLHELPGMNFPEDQRAQQEQPAAGEPAGGEPRQGTPYDLRY